MRRVRETGIPSPEDEFTTRLPRDRHEIRCFVDSFLPVFDANGSVSAVSVIVLDITRRHRAEEALRASEEQYRQLVEDATDIIFRVDFQGRFTFLNGGAIRSSGYSAAELLGHPFAEFVRPDYAKDVERFYARQMTKRIPTTRHRFPAVTKNRGVIWLDQSAQLIFDGERIVRLQAVARDITAIKTVEDALQEAHDSLEAQVRKRTAELSAAESRYRALVEQSLLGVFALRDGQYIYVNPRMAEIFGYTPDELVALSSILETVLAEDRETITRTMQQHTAPNDTLSCGYRGRKKNGEIVHVEVNCRAGILDGTPTLLGTLVEVTERNLLAKQLGQVQRMDVIARLAGGVAHDFNNILTIIRGHADLLLKQLPLDDPRHRNAEKIHDAAGRAASLTSKLLTIGSKRGLQSTPLNLNSVLPDRRI